MDQDQTQAPVRAQRARRRLQRQVREALVREACNRYASAAEAAASIGISKGHLFKMRRELGLVAADHIAREERVRQALLHPPQLAALMLGVSRAHVYRLRRKYAAKTQPEVTSTP